MFATDFCFNGQRASDFGLAIGIINGSNVESSGGTIEYSTVKTPNRNKYTNYGGQLTDVLEWKFTVVKNYCSNNESKYFDQYEESAIAHWLLTPTTGYHWFQFDQDMYQDVWYQVVIQMTPNYLFGKTVGFDLTVTSNCGYGWSEEFVKTKTITKDSPFEFIVHSDIDMPVYPVITISNAETPELDVTSFLDDYRGVLTDPTPDYSYPTFKLVYKNETGYDFNEIGLYKFEEFDKGSIGGRLYVEDGGFISLINDIEQWGESGNSINFDCIYEMAYNSAWESYWYAEFKYDGIYIRSIIEPIIGDTEVSFKRTEFTNSIANYDQSGGGINFFDLDVASSTIVDDNEPLVIDFDDLTEAVRYADGDSGVCIKTYSDVSVQSSYYYLRFEGESSYLSVKALSSDNLYRVKRKQSTQNDLEVVQVIPKVSITQTESYSPQGTFYISNDLDTAQNISNNKETIFRNTMSDKTVILDCDNEIITGIDSPNDFNYYYPRLLNGLNSISTSADSLNIEIRYREPRRVIV